MLLASGGVCGPCAERTINPRVVDELVGAAAAIGNTVVAALAAPVRATRTDKPAMNFAKRREFFMATFRDISGFHVPPAEQQLQCNNSNAQIQPGAESNERVRALIALPEMEARQKHKTAFCKGHQRKSSWSRKDTGNQRND